MIEESEVIIMNEFGENTDKILQGIDNRSYDSINPGKYVLPLNPLPHKFDDEQGRINALLTSYYHNIKRLNYLLDLERNSVSLDKKELKQEYLVFTEKMKSGFINFYNEVHQDLTLNPKQLEGNRVLIKKMNALAIALVNNDSQGISKAILDLEQANKNFGNNNLKPNRVKVAVAAVIGAVVGAIVGLGIVVLATIITGGVGALPGLLCGALAAVSIASTVSCALAGAAIGGSYKYDFFKEVKPASKVNAAINDVIEESRIQITT